jgi:hypothetical protein
MRKFSQLFGLAAILLLLIGRQRIYAQRSSHGDSTNELNKVTQSSTMTFFERAGTCIYGTIQHHNDHTITVQLNNNSVVIKREELFQVRHGDALIFSARSSWADVTGVHVYPHESLVVTLKTGKQVRGKPIKVAGDEITLKHGFTSTRYAKLEIATVDYLRVKPESDGFDYLAQEVPYMLVFYPESYVRVLGLQGKIGVRLYDSAKPEDNAPVSCQKT